MHHSTKTMNVVRNQKSMQCAIKNNASINQQKIKRIKLAQPKEPHQTRTTKQPHHYLFCAPSWVCIRSVSFINTQWVIPAYPVGIFKK